MKNGARLASQVCDTEVIVTRAAESMADLRCGGAQMIPVGETKPDAVPLDPQLADGTLMGKRYVDAAGGEVLVTKAGAGTLTIAATPLKLKEAKPLPASD